MIRPLRRAHLVMVALTAGLTALMLVLALIRRGAP